MGELQDDIYAISNVIKPKGMIGMEKVFRHLHILEKSMCIGHAELFICNTSVDKEDQRENGLGECSEILW